MSVVFWITGMIMPLPMTLEAFRKSCIAVPKEKAYAYHNGEMEDDDLISIHLYAPDTSDPNSITGCSISEHETENPNHRFCLTIYNYSDASSYKQPLERELYYTYYLSEYVNLADVTPRQLIDFAKGQRDNDPEISPNQMKYLNELVISHMTSPEASISEQPHGDMAFAVANAEKDCIEEWDFITLADAINPSETFLFDGQNDLYDINTALAESGYRLIDSKEEATPAPG